MKLNNQKNKLSNTSQQARLNVLPACFRCCFFVLLLVPFLFANKANARLCWDIDNQGCELTDHDQKVGYVFEVSDLELYTRLANGLGFRHWFRIRPECQEVDDDGCDDATSFTVRLGEYQYIGSLQKPDLGSDIRLLIVGGNLRQHDDDWRVNEIVDGRLPEESGFYTNSAYLMLWFSPSLVRNLSSGSHRFIFSIYGKTNDGREQSLVYEFRIGVGNQVQISRLDNMPLGTFPEIKDFEKQDFCVYATGDGSGRGGLFSINASSNTGFNLKRSPADEFEVEYIPMFAVGVDAGRNALQRIDSLSGQTFTGSPTVDCGNSDNMTLGIELNATFQELSVLPAGTYSDVLTITVEAK